MPRTTWPDSYPLMIAVPICSCEIGLIGSEWYSKVGHFICTEIGEREWTSRVGLG